MSSLFIISRGIIITLGGWHPAQANKQTDLQFQRFQNPVLGKTKARSKKSSVEWLCLADLRSLDVVLSQSTHLGSKVNAALTRGEFSHASFVIDKDFWFDAVPAGCGIYSPSIDAVPGDDGWYLDVRPYRKIKILRHPVVVLLSDQRRMDLQELARKYCDGLTGTSYARYEMLLPLVRYPLLNRVLTSWPNGADKLARAIDRVHAILRANRGMRAVLTWESILCGYKGRSSYFCSEIVVNIHEALGLDISRDGTSAASFTPDDLYDERRSLLETVHIALRSFPISKPKRGRHEGDKVMAEGERIIAFGAKVLREMEDFHRKSFNKERLENYLAKAALRPSPELAEKAFRIRSAIAALLKEGNRLLQLNLNLKDLEDTAKGQPAIYANQSLREWLGVIEKRLRRDDPVQPQTKELARQGLAELGPSTAEKSSAAAELHTAFKTLLRNCIRLHAVATARSRQMLRDFG